MAATCSALCFGLATAADAPMESASARINPVLVRTLLIILLLLRVWLDVLRLKPFDPTGGKRRAKAAHRSFREPPGSFTEDLCAEVYESKPEDARPTVAFLLTAAF